MILLQTTGVLIDSQIIGSFIQVFFGALVMLTAAGLAHLYAKRADDGERIARLEEAQEWYLRSSEKNRRREVLEDDVPQPRRVRRPRQDYRRRR